MIRGQKQMTMASDDHQYNAGNMAVWNWEWLAHRWKFSPEVAKGKKTSGSFAAARTYCQKEGGEKRGE